MVAPFMMTPFGFQFTTMELARSAISSSRHLELMNFEDQLAAIGPHVGDRVS